MYPTVVLIGSDQLCCRTMYTGTMRKVKQMAAANNLKHWAIYRQYVNGRIFHNATDPAYLVEHNNDPFWLNTEAKTGVHRYIICKGFDTKQVVCSWEGDFDALSKFMPGFSFHVLRIEPACVYLAAVVCL